MKNSLLRRSATLALTIPLVMGLAACSDDSGDNEDSSTATSTSASAKHIKGLPDGFDLQAHRGGRGENTEESAQAFRYAIETGLSTLELELVIAKDGIPVVSHDPDVQAEKCHDTAPATPNDHMYPYRRKLGHNLHWAQLQTVSCDTILAEFPGQKVA